MPALSLGLGQREKSATYNVELWISLGGRGIDTAWNYWNQANVAAGVRAAIAKGIVKREEVFITTKISPLICTRWFGLAAVRDSVWQLGGLTPDLVLHHSPCLRFSPGSNVNVWKGLQDALAQGLTRSIGVTRYSVTQLREVLAAGGVPPAVYQGGLFIGQHDNVNDAIRSFCRKHGIKFMAVSPLSRLNHTGVLTSVAHAHNATTAQVALRWINQQSVPLATSLGASTRARDYAAKDLAIGDFTLTDDEMATLSKI